MADDPMDLFDKFADGIRNTQDELEAADTVREEKAAARKKTRTEAPPPAGAEPPEPE